MFLSKGARWPPASPKEFTDKAIRRTCSGTCPSSSAAIEAYPAAHTGPQGVRVDGERRRDP